MVNRQITFVGLFVVAAVLVLSLEGCTTAGKQNREPEGTLLAHGELAALYGTPRVAEFASSRGISTLTYAPDGMQTLKKGTFTDTGTYRIDGDTICSKWNKIRNGREACSRMYRIGENRYRVVYTSGREGGILTFK